MLVSQLQSQAHVLLLMLQGEGCGVLVLLHWGALHHTPCCLDDVLCYSNLLWTVCKSLPCLHCYPLLSVNKSNAMLLSWNVYLSDFKCSSAAC